MTISHPDRFADPTLIEGIAREVIRRLVGATADAMVENGCGSTGEVATGKGERLITVETLNNLAGASEVVSAAGGVVTPAARDEAVTRGIKIVQSAQPAKINTTSAAISPGTVPDDDQPEHQILTQLRRRGFSLPDGIELVWTNQPAKEVFRLCGTGRRAAMINSLSDVDRFAAELAPQVWVLDRQKLNLVAAVNVAARIARHKVSEAPSPGGSQ